MGDDSVLDGLEHFGSDIVSDVAADLSGAGEVETVIHGGKAIGNLAAAGYHAVVGDSTTARQDLGDAAAEGFDTVPFHEAAWDGMMTLGRTIDGPGNNDQMWDQGGEGAFREAWGGTPQAPAAPAPYDPDSTGPQA